LDQKLIPGEALIYERADDVLYARYRDPPHNRIPRWIVGGDADGVSRAQGNLFSYSEWQEMMHLANEYPTLKSQMKKLVNIYYLCKESK
tara:strand:- start:10963 stop:11229 length:267 start_codon:yes stop_codon:yes gene_type:complete